MKKETLLSLPDLDLNLLNVNDSDDVFRKMLMLIEGTYGKGIQHSIRKYGYTEQRYHQLLKSFKESGTEALYNKKKGPKANYVRTDKLKQLIIRYRFLDPQSSAKVIAQKLEQEGYSISIRSVERTIQEYGMQKKTL
ncbi:MAG TPA: hypothetical protein VK590_13205 [Saprospiraceae bacterium]|nr:hypothetical protein [Saprospiraceae bacterium]